MGTKDTVAASPLSQAMAMAVKLHMVRRNLQQKDLVELAGRSEMPPQTPIHISLEILDPGTRAVNYSLSFHSPE